MSRVHRLLTAVMLAVICFSAEGARAFADAEDPIRRILAAGQQAVLERHFAQAIRIFRDGVKDHPEDQQLRLELGRAYLAHGEDGLAIKLFREILRTSPGDRQTQLELAGALGFRHDYTASNDIYRELLVANLADEAAAIGLASNLLHQRRRSEARTLVRQALGLHPESLRLQEYMDRIDSGNLGGEGREGRVAQNLVQIDADYFNDSAGNHSWRSGQRIDLGIRPGLTSRVVLEQHLQRGKDDVFETAETSIAQVGWKPREWLFLSGGGGAVRFNDGDVNAVYETSLAFQPVRALLFGGDFSRVPIIPNAEATGHKITAQGWEAFAGWTGAHWQLSARASRQRYSDGNIGSRQMAEVLREWRIRGVGFETGYRFRHYGFELDPAHGYFSPSDYQSHLAAVGVRLPRLRKYRGEFLARGGAESAGAGQPFTPAWEINFRNEVLLGNWTLQLDYSKYHLAQDTGAFRADAGRFAIAYHF